jgi:hypothetical protein
MSLATSLAIFDHQLFQLLDKIHFYFTGLRVAVKCCRFLGPVILTAPEQRIKFWRRAFLSLTMPMAAPIVDDSNELLEGGEVAGECDAGSPGSGGASPYLRLDLP